MIDLTNEMHIDRPPEEVTSHVLDPTQWHRWRDAMRTPARKRGSDSISKGSQFDYQSAFMGREVDAVFEVIAYEPGRKISATTDVPVSVRLTFRCEPAGEGTRVIQETQGEVGGFFGIAEPLVKPLMSRSFQKSLESLKSLLEERS